MQSSFNQIANTGAFTWIGIILLPIGVILMLAAMFLSKKLSKKGL